MKVVVRGHSDDIVMTEGPLSNEFYGKNTTEDPGFMAFSDGTLLKIVYGGGNGAFWRITPIYLGSAAYSKVEATNDDSEYSDIVTLEGDISWVLYGDRYEGVKPSRRSP